MKKNFKNQSYDNEVTDFYDKSLDSTLKKDGNYYLNVFLKECKYIEKEVV